MSNLKSLHRAYKSIYQELKDSENYKTKDFIGSYLCDFTELVLEDWCGSLFLTTSEYAPVEGSGHEILFTATAYHNKRVSNGSVSHVPVKTRIAVLDNGDLVTFDRVTEKDGSQTYTGDCYIDCYSTKFTVKETLYTSELFNDFSKGDDITSEQIESIAVEIAQEIIDLHQQTTFNK